MGTTDRPDHHVKLVAEVEGGSKQLSLDHDNHLWVRDHGLISLLDLFIRRLDHDRDPHLSSLVSVGVHLIPPHLRAALWSFAT